MSNPNCDNVGKQPTKPRKKNALARGVYGKDILLPWEPMKDFKKLLADLRDEFRPEGRMENEIVFDLAHSRWQKYRVRQMYIAAAYGDPFVSGLVESRQKSWAGMRNHLKWKSANEHALSKMINEIFMEQVEESAKRLEKTLREGKLDNSKTAQGKAFLDVSKNFTIPLIEALEAQPSVEDLFRRSSSELLAIDPKDPEAPARVAATTEGQGRCTVRVSPGGVTGIGANPQKIGRFQRKSRSGIFSSRGARASTSGLRRAPYYVKGAPPNATLSTPFGGLPP